MDANRFRTVNSIARPAEIEEPINLLLIHPAARALLPHALRIGVHPNVVSIAGIGCGVLAAAAFQRFDDWRMTLAGAAAMICWHICDGLDGMVARAAGKTSDFGRFLDGFCDYSVFVLVYVSLVFAITSDIGSTAAWLLAVGAGAAHAVQSAWYEAQRELFVRRIRGDFAARRRKPAGGILERVYNAGQARMTADAERLDSWLRSAEGDLDAYRRQAVPLMRFANLFAQTGRTLAITIACLAGLPMLFWIWEIALLPLLLAAESLRKRRERALIV